MVDEQRKSVDRVELRASVLSVRIDGIMQVHIKAVDEFLPEDINDFVNGLYKIGEGKKFANLITFEDYVVIGKETRALSAEAISGKYTIADAIVVKSIPLKLTTDFYIAFNKPARPTRSFSSEEEGIKWLKTFL